MRFRTTAVGEGADNELTSHVMIDNSDVLAALALIQREYPTAKASFETACRTRGIHNDD